MATPSEKSPEMEFKTNQVSQLLFGRKRTHAIHQDICVVCGNPATEFKDDLSRKEYTISGMCQKCQDETFDPAHDTDMED